MAAPLFHRALPFLRHRLIPQHIRRISGPVTLRSCCGTAESSRTDDDSPYLGKFPSSGTAKVQTNYSRWDDPDFRKWKDKEAEILNDIEPIICLTKEILHSYRFSVLPVVYSWAANRSGWYSKTKDSSSNK